MSARGLISTGLVSLCVIACAVLMMSVSAFAASAPVLGEESALNVSGDSATLQGEVNPEGSATTYRFEYGTSESYGQNAPTPEGSAGAGTGVVTVEAHVQDLQPSTTYHYRVVASSEGGTEHGIDGSFTTQRNGGESTLPDGRQYEMVTPPQKEGALFFGIGAFDSGYGNNHLIQAAADGNAIADLASQPTEAEPQGYANDASVLSTRGPGGWSSQVISPPHDSVSTNSGQGTEYRLFAEDLSRGAVQQFGQFAPLAPEVSESTPYLRTEYLNGNVTEHCHSGCFQPLVTLADDTASPFQPFGDAGCIYVYCGPKFDGASPDLSHVVFSSKAQLTSAPSHTIGEEGEPEGGGLYEWFGGNLRLVSVFPPGEEGVESKVGLAGGYEFAYENESEGTRRAISEDGERVIFTTHIGSSLFGLYLRDFAKNETVRLDVPEAGATGFAGGAQYMTASRDASRVFFIDSELTAESSASGPDLYEYDLNAPSGSRLTDLSVDRNAGEAADVLAVLGASDDGSYVYFVAGGALTPNAVPGTCQGPGVGKGVTEGCNVYVRHDGATSLVAAGWMDKGNDSASEWSRVSPDGRWLAFMSPRSLTGYDTRDAFSGQADAEVYLYDASTGKLVCASCDPTGARPVGAQTPKAGWVAGNVPGWTHTGGFYGPLYQSRYLSDSGRLFFESDEALVPQDVNGTGDVYEYGPEGVPAGVHACAASGASGSEVYKPARTFEVQGHGGEEGAGCLSLISAGTSSGESSFLDASETGGDVFFLTASKLASQDFDNALDVYDAHECTNVSPCTPPVQVPPPCVTESSCRAAPTPQPSIFGDPSSATFKGTGNLTPVPTPVVKSKPKSGKSVRCKRGFVKRHGKCVRAKSKAKKQAKKSAGKGRK